MSETDPSDGERPSTLKFWIAGGVAALALAVAAGAVVSSRTKQFERPVGQVEPPAPRPDPDAPPKPAPRPAGAPPTPVVTAPTPPPATPPGVGAGAPVVKEPPTPEVVPSPIEIAPSPREVAAAPPPAPPAPPAPEAEPVPAKLDARGLAIPVAPARLDGRSAAELEKALLAVREVSLDAPGATRVAGNLQSFAKQQKTNNQPYTGSALAASARPDLAGMPFRIGLDSVLPRERAQAMNGMSKQLREAIQTCIPSTDDPRPDADELFATLISEKKGSFRNRDKKQWARAEAVPCVVQMLQAENRDIRRMSCEILKKLEADEATEALVKWAVFDTDSGNRSAAIDALRSRDRALVARLLADRLDYPWPRAVEHACEALAALGAKEALPRLAAAYDRPDADAPFLVELPNKSGGIFRQELVRVNHARNCVLCHTPSFNESDLVRGAVPDPARPLAPPTTPAYYNSGGQFVAAEVTYLQQDFSQVQPVLNAGNWPGHQRYDYFVSVRRDTGAVPAAPAADSPYRAAYRHAIRALANHDPDRDVEWMAEQRKLAPPSADDRVAAVAKALSLEANPNALASLKMHEYVKPPLEGTAAEWGAAVTAMQKTHGLKASRLALIAYLDPLTRGGAADSRAKAAKLLAVANGSTPDAGLAKAMRTALE